MAAIKRSGIPEPRLPVGREPRNEDRNLTLRVKVKEQRG